MTGKRGGERQVTRHLKSQLKDLGFHHSDVEGHEAGTWAGVHFSSAILRNGLILVGLVPTA